MTAQTTTTASVAALIARLGEATGLRELDAELHALAIGAELLQPFDGEYAEFRKGGRDFLLPSDTGNPLPPYTTSIDAALTLVPEGLYYVLGYGRTLETEPLGAAGLKHPDSADGDWVCQSEAATVPLALCIAALLARQTP